MTNKVESASPADVEDVTTSAAASTAGEQEQEETLSDVINQALSGEGENEGEGDDGGEGDDPGDEPGEGDEPPDEAGKPKADASAEPGNEDEDDDGLDVKKGQTVPYDRFHKVIKQRNEVRQQAETVVRERDQFRQGHEQYTAIQQYMAQNELRTEDVVEALQIAAAFNRDPKRAAEMLAPKLEALQKATGHILPEDLQRRVEMGELSEGDAREIVGSRNEAARLQREVQKRDTAQQQQEQQRQTVEVRTAMAQAANVKQAQLAKADPEFDRKAPFVRKELQLLLTQYSPRSAEEAVQLVQRAYENVNAELGKLLPKTQIRRGPSSVQGVTSSPSANEPATMAEAIKAALG
jgi:hypothetical protein